MRTYDTLHIDASFILSGFTIVKDLTVDVESIVAPARSARVWNDKASNDEAFVGASSPNVDIKTEKPSSTDERVPEGGSPYAKSEDELARSPPGSPQGKSSLESPSQDFRATDFGKNMSADASPRVRESYRYRFFLLLSLFIFFVSYLSRLSRTHTLFNHTIFSSEIRDRRYP